LQRCGEQVADGFLVIDDKDRAVRRPFYQIVSMCLTLKIVIYPAQTFNFPLYHLKNIEIDILFKQTYFILAQ